MYGKEKKMSTGMLYLIGMALVVVGFFLPMFKAGPIEPNGLAFLNFDNFGFVTIGGLLILVGAAAGVILNFLDVKNKKLLQLVALVASIAGGVILVIGFNDNTLQGYCKGLPEACLHRLLRGAGWLGCRTGGLPHRKISHPPPYSKPPRNRFPRTSSGVIFFPNTSSACELHLIVPDASPACELHLIVPDTSPRF